MIDSVDGRSISRANRDWVQGIIELFSSEFDSKANSPRFLFLVGIGPAVEEWQAGSIFSQLYLIWRLLRGMTDVRRKDTREI